MFLGDVGSITLGFNSAVILLWIISSGSEKSGSWIVVLIPMYFFVEGVCVATIFLARGACGRLAVSSQPKFCFLLKLCMVLIMCKKN